MSRSVEEVQQKVEKWLLDENFNINKNKDEKSFFSYNAARANLPILVILQPKMNKDSIVIACLISFGEGELEKVAKMPVEEKEEMFWNLRMLLLQCGCRFVFVPSLEIFKFIQISEKIYYDGLSKNSFFQTVNKVTDAALVVIFTFQRKLGVKPQQERIEPKYVS
jgi:hypothetical protein